MSDQQYLFILLHDIQKLLSKFSTVAFFKMIVNEQGSIWLPKLSFPHTAITTFLIRIDFGNAPECTTTFWRSECLLR